MSILNPARIRYDHRDTEIVWQAIWEESGLDTVDIKGASKPFFNLLMFPYPSAEGLHVGNMYAFTGSDIYGRYMRLKGYDVFEPIGLDGFGIHSENYALKVGRHPMDHAVRTEQNFYKQLRSIGGMFDWTRTIETYKPGYYRWTQWLFTEMFKHGLAYRGEALVNWCPGCKTVLSDEQVVNELCERCGNIVQKKSLEQWFFRITAYADKLEGNISSLDWSDKVKTAQKIWIGKKDGITISYKVFTAEGEAVGEVSCYTVHPNTNYGATFVVLAPEHPFINRIIEVTDSAVADRLRRYVSDSCMKTPEERAGSGRKKSGINTTLYCVNQLTGYRMLLYVSDFVLMNVGTGAVVGVPAHDERDYEFARTFTIESKQVVTFTDELHAVISKHSCIPGVKDQAARMGAYTEERDTDYAFVVPKELAGRLIAVLQEGIRDSEGFAVIDGSFRGLVTKNAVLTDPKVIADFLAAQPEGTGNIWPVNENQYPFCYTKPGTMVNSDILNGMTSSQANAAIMDKIESSGWGSRKTTYHLRDWLISRQRYWGPPIPMIRCNTCKTNGASWFTSEEGKRYQSKSRTAKISSEHINAMAGWYPVPDPELPVELPRINDYKPGDDGIAPLAKHSEFYRTTCPGCGADAVRESDVSDTFLDSAWYFLRYPTVGSPGEKTTAFDTSLTKKWLPVSMYTGGAEHSVLHLLYARFIAMVLADFGYLEFEEPFTRFFAHGLVIKDGAKMSKSKGNVVNPDEYIKLYGSDALRMYLMFMGPFSQGGDFRDTAMEGMSRFVTRIWRFVNQVQESQAGKSGPTVTRALARTIYKAGEDIERRHYNTAISAFMEFMNTTGDSGEAFAVADAKKLVIAISPFAPHLAEELYQKLSGRTREKFRPDLSVHKASWPEIDKALLDESDVTIVVQVMGKVRGRLKIPRLQAGDQAQISAQAAADPQVVNHLAGKKILKTVFVPGKLINFVVA